MNLQEFEKQINRLIEVYGEKHYAGERKKLLWGEFKDLEPWIFMAAVGRLIGDCAQAPMMYKFREVIGILKNTQYEYSKKETERVAKDFHSGIMPSEELTPEEVKMFIAGTLDILDTKDETVRLKKSEEHQRFISSVYEGKRRQ